MSRRYDVELLERMLLIASNAASVEEFRPPHDHAKETCLECDAHRRLASWASGGMSLHKLRRTLGGHGAEYDPLDPPLLACWRLNFVSSATAQGALQPAQREWPAIVQPVRDDPSAIELRVSLHDDELEPVRTAVSEWAAERRGWVASEQLVDWRRRR